jgi:hypothetical protein
MKQYCIILYLRQVQATVFAVLLCCAVLLESSTSAICNLFSLVTHLP